MQTIIKWPGGKTSEYSIIKNFIPKFDRYIEPFFGGGAVFFNMPPQKAIINDISKNLMQFYSFVKEQNIKFKDYLYFINDEWNALKYIALQQAKNLSPIFIKYRNKECTKLEAQTAIINSCTIAIRTISNNSIIITEKTTFSHEICRMVNDKFFRTASNEIKNQIWLCDNDLLDNIVTGFLSGYYMYMRNVLNSNQKNNNIVIADEYKSAIFYFVREFCYGSMFRYNKQGDFNIPYGGIAYNNKDFKKKIDLLFSNETQLYFVNTNIYATDFENIFDLTNKEDFIFLDPPYDTEFSAYENKTFGEKEQRRLAKRLHETKSKFLLIIKNTPLISELYQNNGYKVYAFDNKYSYCVKGRNDRNAVHLIITNFDLNKTV